MLRIVGVSCAVGAVGVAWFGDALPWLEQRRARRRAQDLCADTVPDLADVLDAIERDTRQGHSLHSALQRVVRRHVRIDSVLPRCTAVARDALPIDEWCTTTLRHNPNPTVHTAVGALLLAARTGAPHRSLSVAARILRQRRTLHDEARLATAQVRASIQALTALPIIVLVILVSVDAGARSAVLRPVGLAVTLAGIGANVLGRRWLRRMYLAALAGDDAVPDVLDALSLHVAAGMSPARAVLDVADAHTAAGTFLQSVRADVERGALVSDVLRRRRSELDPQRTGWVDDLVDAEREGFALARLLEHLAVAARDERRLGVQRRLRTLSVRVTLPLVTCVLPAFVLLAIVPMVAGVVTHLGDMS